MDNKDVINYHIWTDDIQKSILDDIKKYKPKVINIFAAEEHEITGTWSDQLSQPYKNIFIKNGIEVNYLFGSTNREFYEDRYHFPEHNINVHLWPTYFLSFTYESIRNNSFFQFPNLKDFRYPIISLNNRPHTHRCLMLDMLAKYDLINNNAITWHNDHSVNSPYNYKFWKKPKKLYLEDNFEKTQNSYYLPTEYWSGAFLHVVSECSIKNSYISEKTWMPVLGKKLFISQSKHGFYRDFKALGFELYDEIFDYSFDEIIDVDKRTDEIMSQVKKIILGKKYSNIYNKLKDKLEYNSNLAKKIAINNDIPEIVKKNKVEYYNYVRIMAEIN